VVSGLRLDVKLLPRIQFAVEQIWLTAHTLELQCGVSNPIFVRADIVDLTLDARTVDNGHILSKDMRGKRAQA